MSDISQKENEESEIEFDPPKQEIDEPLNFQNGAIQNYEKISNKDIDIKEKDKDRKEKRYFSAFKLIVGCLIFLGIIYLIEVITSIVLKGEPSSSTSGIIEIIKTLLFTLSGYLFARKENGD